MSTHTKQRKDRKSRATNRCDKNRHIKKQRQLMEDILSGKIALPTIEPKWRAELIKDGSYFAYAAILAERSEKKEKENELTPVSLDSTVHFDEPNLEVISKDEYAKRHPEMIV